MTARVAADVRPGRDGAVRCWHYATSGLRRSAGYEVDCFVAIAGSDDERAPAEPLAMLAAVAGLAARGVRVGVGDLTVFGAPAGPPRAFCYVHSVGDGATSGDRLTAIVLQGAEVAVAQSVGATRVLARLGAAAGVHPFPVWNEPGREPVARDNEASLLDRLSRMRVNGSVELRGMTIALGLERRSAEPLRRELETLAPAAPVALLTGLAPRAAAQLIWHPGQRGPRALHGSAGHDAPPGDLGDRVGGTFAAFVPESDRDAGVLTEDGFCLRFTDSTWSAVRDALIGGQPHRVEAAVATDYGFELTWR